MIVFMCDTPDEQPEDIKEHGPGAKAVRVYLVMPIGLGLVRDTDVFKGDPKRIANLEEAKSRVESFIRGQGGSPVLPVLNVPGEPSPSIPLMQSGDGCQLGGGSTDRELVRETLHSMVDEFMSGFCRGEDQVRMVAKVAPDGKFGEMVVEVVDQFSNSAVESFLRQQKPTAET